jgi:hypothetical protein
MSASRRVIGSGAEVNPGRAGVGGFTAAPRHPLRAMWISYEAVGVGGSVPGLRLAR